MERNEIIPEIRRYNKTLSPVSLTKLEKQFVQVTEDRDYFYGFPYGFSIKDVLFPDTAEKFIEDQNGFRGLLGENAEKLCFYLRNIQDFTCNTELIRMDVRSKVFSRYARKVTRAIGAFYLFYGLRLSMKDLIYGVYRAWEGDADFAPVVAAELLAGNEEVIGYCREVLLSENNTAALTRCVIKAVEQSRNRELQGLLMKVFLAAKLQEGLRQSVLETVDEHNREYFLEMTEVIEQENLLRFSSVQRAVLTWIGIGYEEASEKDLRYIFSHIRKYFMSEKEREAALSAAENPLDVYLALYCIGTEDVETAVQRACVLLEDTRRYVVASALIYLKLTYSFDVEKYLYFTKKYADDDWILALYYSECESSRQVFQRLTWEEAYELYGAIESFLPKVGARKTWSSKGFAWFSVTHTKDSLCNCLFDIMDKYPEKELVERFLPYVPGLYYNRVDRFMEKRFGRASEQARKDFMLKEVLTSNEALVKWIGKEYLKVSLTEEELLLLEGRLKSKKAKSRACIVRVLAAQKEEWVRASYERLLASPVKTIRESAQELKNLAPQYFGEQKKTVIKGSDEGFGLYTPGQQPDMLCDNTILKVTQGLFRKAAADVGYLFPWKKKQVLDYLKKWDARITAHENEEYYNGYEYKQVKDRGFWPIDHSKHSLDGLALSEVWRNYFAEDGLQRAEIFELYFLMITVHDSVYLEKLLEVRSDLFTLAQDDIKGLTYFGHFETILTRYFWEEEARQEYVKEAAAILALVGKYAKGWTYVRKNYRDEKETYAVSNNRSISAMMQALHMERADDDTFRKYFPVLLIFYNNYNLKLPADVKMKYVIEPLLLARALCLGLITKEFMFEGLLDMHMHEEASQYSWYRPQTGQLSLAYRDAYFEGKGIWGSPRLSLEGYKHPAYSYKKEVYECLRNVLDEVTDTLLAMETGRLNEKTAVTDYVENLYVIMGIGHLVQALHVLDGEELCRQAYGSDRNAVFSNVIRHCYPNEGDDVQILKSELFGEKRLVETAMLAPQWIDKINEVLGWDGFREACYYFTAHMKQYDYVQKKAEIARYTELEPEDLNDGAFDMQWCRSVYETLGEKRFQIVYKASKFLCDNSFHTRGRKYADACLGKVGKEEWRAQAEEKRNKDALNAYCICPLEGDRDLLERYLFVQQFLKESKKFGAQRQASEKRAVEMAMLNLARNSRFETVTRLAWAMESETVSQDAWALEPRRIADTAELWIEIDSQGACEILVSKKGKKQKSVPAAVKKDEQYLKLKEVHARWKEQYRRSRKMLEQAMEERTELSVEELETIAKNPIVEPMLEKLVIVSGTQYGFYKEGLLYGPENEGGLKLETGALVRIAHPYDLYAAGNWHRYQQYVFEKKMVQPFKQVFRELYLVTEDERDKNNTRRYSGYQIQPKKAAAALKTRRWNVSYESGLERVYYKENLIVNLFAEADWFSPGDIEAPAIEYVAFYVRKGNDEVRIGEIDPVVFSETMRDVDLAVSTAYVGGVDPVTSFSTIELRRTIVEYTCRLMKLENVTVREHFADIKGVYNNYSVHLGSGVIHQSGGGAIYMIAVHSQKRGKVYLPFLDEDPKTAEIISKILMLAEDGKIKDPEILRQIQTKI